MGFLKITMGDDRADTICTKSAILIQFRIRFYFKWGKGFFLLLFYI